MWGVVLGLAAVNVFGIIPLADDSPAKAVLNYLVPFLLLVISAGQLAMYVVEWDQGSGGGGDLTKSLAFGLNIASTLPGLINWLKLVPPPELMPIAVAAVDVVGVVVDGILIIVLALEEAG